MIRPLISAFALALSATGCGQDHYSDCNQGKDLDRQISGCTQVIERGKQESRENRAVAYNNRGVVYAAKGEFDRAIADFDKAIALDPEDAAPYFNRGRAYFRKGESDRAIADFRKALEIHPSNQQVRERLESYGVTP